MLSRVAERTYWLARYLERAENMARLVNVYSALLLDLPRSAELGWDVVLEISASTDAFAATGRQSTEPEILAFLLHDEANSSSLLCSLSQARENARTTRDIVPTEGWRAVNELFLYAREHLPEAAQPLQRTKVMSHVVERVHEITGLLAGTMSQGQPYQFTRLGRNLERADMTTRMIDVAAAVLMTGRPELKRYDNTLWMMVLRCLSAYQMYRQYVRRRVRAPDVIGFLLQDEDFPRAVAHCARELTSALQRLPRAEAPLARARRMHQRLDDLVPDALDNSGIHRLVDELQLEIAGINDTIASTWFFPGKLGVKDFYCRCGQRVFFDNTRCVACNSALGFDPLRMDIVMRDPGYRSCSNAQHDGLCNWLVPADTDWSFCLACGLNDVIPLLETPGNVRLWARLEAAKRRLLYTLLSLGLPIAGPSGKPGLRFRFMEDQRRNPDVREEFIATGHHTGTITINLGEADDVQRTAEREAMFERYRTLLVHFRHESGHYYFDVLVRNAGYLDQCRAIFGDERIDYAEAVGAYYRNGPRDDWSARFVSPYATAHPHEDWAESFAHYLHIVDALETAHAAGLATLEGDVYPGWIFEWMRLSVTLNELNRGLGLDDSYPFVLTQPVIEKLEFIDRLVHQQGEFGNLSTAGAAALQTHP